METDFKAGRVMRATVSAQWLINHYFGNLDLLKSSDDGIFKEFDTALVIDSLRQFREQCIPVVQWLSEESELSNRQCLLALILDIFAEPTAPTKDSPVFDLTHKIEELFTTIKNQDPIDFTPLVIAMNLARLDENIRLECINFILRNPRRSLEAVHHFYSTSDPLELYKRLCGRWHECSYAVKDFLDLNALNPLLLQLVPPVHIGASLSFVPRLVRALASDTKVADMRALGEELAKQIRLIQWEVFTRVPPSSTFLGVKESTQGATGLPSPDFLQKLSRFSRFAHRRYFVGVIGRPHDRDTNASFEGPWKYPDYDSFSNLLAKASQVHPTLHDDLIESLRAREGDNPPQYVVIDDGELTFFSLLWTLRHGGTDALDKASWFGHADSVPQDLPVKFTFPAASPEWCLISFVEYFDWLGLSLLDGDELILTRRWRAFVMWVQSDSTSSPFMKNLLDRNEPSIKGLIERVSGVKIAAEAWLKSERINAYSYSLPFAEGRGLLQRLLLQLYGAIDPAPASGWDADLIRLCRVPFLPLELVLRVYQPHEMSLLIALLGFHPERVNEQMTLAPISLGFATLVGMIPKATYNEASAPSWIDPYWSFLSSLAAEIGARHLAAKLSRGTELRNLRARVTEDNRMAEVSVHNQCMATNFENWRKHDAVAKVIEFLHLGVGAAKLFRNDSPRKLPDGIAEAFKIMALDEERVVTSIVLTLLAAAIHMRLGGEEAKCNIESLREVQGFAMWDHRAALRESEMLDLFWDMCEKLFEPPSRSKEKSNLESIYLTDDRLEIRVNVQFSGLSTSLAERVRRVLSGDPLRGTSRTSTFSILRFWLASTNRDNTRGVPDWRGCFTAQSNFKLEPVDDDENQTLLIWERRLEKKEGTANVGRGETAPCR